MRSDREQALEAEISRIRALGLNELRTLWRSTFRSLPPPPLTKDLMARFVCWHIQEQAFGGPIRITAGFWTALSGATSRERTTLGVSGLAPSWLGNTRANDTRLRSLAMATCGATPPMPASRPSHAPSPVRPGAAHGSSGFVLPGSDRRTSCAHQQNWRCPKDLIADKAEASRSRAAAYNDEADPTNAFPLRSLYPQVHRT
jgi:hypothetical protein